MDDETTYKLLKLLEGNPHISQREIARLMGVSLGKANYCLKALTQKGFIKLQNFYKNKQKRGYVYFLTPKGIKTKSAVTYRFLQRKLIEYENIKLEIENLKAEAYKEVVNENDNFKS